ncbi:uncharacterized protein HKW66_Vig0225570 [Vigna angularis]|uniref:Uncharacterized protein n=1 Tax=Phaseolus angularis TaxID=3914 RepID=A0A8T0JZ25_PHAAN|nr:uncharacterized protein HKW66_Vig0225570 [Vigna angularis]
MLVQMGGSVMTKNDTNLDVIENSSRWSLTSSWMWNYSEGRGLLPQSEGCRLCYMISGERFIFGSCHKNPDTNQLGYCHDIIKLILLVKNKIWCTESNEIGKAALKDNGLKKTKDGWVFKDVDETPSTFTPQTEFERFVVDRFRMLSTRISKVEKSLIMIHRKSDEDNALITPSASESDDEDDTTEVEFMETSDSD